MPEEAGGARYSTLVRPSDLSRIIVASIRFNGITAADVTPAPTFSQIADRVDNILHGRIWAGHNILRFDCPRLREAFAEINQPPPEPKGTIDSLTLTKKFGRRAGDMKIRRLTPQDAAPLSGRLRVFKLCPFSLQGRLALPLPTHQLCPLLSLGFTRRRVFRLPVRSRHPPMNLPWRRLCPTQCRTIFRSIFRKVLEFFGQTARVPAPTPATTTTTTKLAWRSPITFNHHRPARSSLLP